MRPVVLLLALVLIVATCSTPRTADPQPSSAARVLLVGDLMVGRGVAPAMAADPAGVFAGLAHYFDGADIVGANLESPLTTSPTAPGVVNDLRADPANGRALATAGFDVMSVANNHLGDGGASGITETIATLEHSGIAVIGLDWPGDEAAKPFVFDVGAITIAFLAFDATGLGPPPTSSSPGVTAWDRNAAENAVSSSMAAADVVIVSVHGGAEYVGFPDRAMEGIAGDLSRWGADVVWGHGAHVAQPVTVIDPDGDGRPTIVATSLGNFLFDQDPGPTSAGLMLEVLAGPGGIRGYRVGETKHTISSITFGEWRSPSGDAVAFAGSWWVPTPLAGSPATAAEEPFIDWFNQGDIVTATKGDVTGDGELDIAISFRRPFSETPMHRLLPDVQWQDAAGRSAHVGIYSASDQSPIWVAGTVARPVQTVVACDGALALGLSTLDDPTEIAGGAWAWNGFGFSQLPDLDGAAEPGCIDLDGNGDLEVLLHR